MDNSNIMIDVNKLLERVEKIVGNTQGLTNLEILKILVDLIEDKQQ